MSAINVGNKITKESYEGVVEGIVKIFKAAEEYHTDEVTTREALKILTGAAGVTGVSISESTFNGSFPDCGDSCGVEDDTKDEEGDV